MARRKKRKLTREVRETAAHVYRQPYYDRARRTWFVRRRNKETGQVEAVKLAVKGGSTARINARDAVKALVDRENERLKKGKPPPGKSSDKKLLKEALDEWTEIRKAELRSTSVTDLRSRVSQLKAGFKRLNVEHVEEVHYKHIEDFLHKTLDRLPRKTAAESPQDGSSARPVRSRSKSAQRPPKPRKGRTKRKYLHDMRKFFGWCLKHGYCDINPVEDFEPPRAWGADIRKAKDTGKVLSFGQCQRLLRACRKPFTKEVGFKSGYRRNASWEQTFQPREHLYTAVLIALRSGLRIGNITRMRWHNLDLEKGTVSFTAEEMKTDRKFKAPLHPELWQHLRDLLSRRKQKLGRVPHPDEYVLDLPGEKAREFKNGFQGALRRAGLTEEPPYTDPPEGFRPHDTRHTFARFLKKHCVYDAVRQLLGHAKTTETDRYGELDFEEVRQELARLPWLSKAQAKDLRAEQD